ncbi:unnamed protein product [Sympodiomycopsis kandeliae]
MLGNQCVDGALGLVIQATEPPTEELAGLCGIHTRFVEFAKDHLTDDPSSALTASVDADEDGPASILYQELIISDSIAVATSQEVEITAVARLAKMGFFLSLLQGRRRYEALIEYIMTACVCPLCPWSPSKAPIMQPESPMESQTASEILTTTLLGLPFSAVRDKRGHMMGHDRLMWHDFRIPKADSRTTTIVPKPDNLYRMTTSGIDSQARAGRQVR